MPSPVKNATLYAARQARPLTDIFVPDSRSRQCCHRQKNKAFYAVGQAQPCQFPETPPRPRTFLFDDTSAMEAIEITIQSQHVAGTCSGLSMAIEMLVVLPLVRSESTQCGMSRNSQFSRLPYSSKGCSRGPQNTGSILLTMLEPPP